MINYFMPHVVRVGENRYIYRRADLLSCLIYIIPVFGWLKFLIDYNKQYSNPIFRYYSEVDDKIAYRKYTEGQIVYGIDDIYRIELNIKSRKVLSFKDIEKEYSIKQLQK